MHLTICNSFINFLNYLNVICQPERFKKFGRVVVNIGEDDFRARIRCGIDYAEQN